MTALDLRGVICPMTWVKTRIALEGLDPGETLEVHLDEAEALESVPRSARDEGHTVEVAAGTVTIVKGPAR